MHYFLHCADRHSIVCREAVATCLISDAAPALYVAAKLQQHGLQTINKMFFFLSSKHTATIFSYLKLLQSLQATLSVQLNCSSSVLNFRLKSELVAKGRCL